MSNENDPNFIRWLGGAALALLTMVFGWIFHRTNKANDIATAISIKLSEYYMKREEVKTDIKEARAELREDLKESIVPVHRRLDKIESNLESITAWLMKQDS